MAFQRARKVAWDKNVVAMRQKLGFSQTKFAQLLGISFRTLHHWEQGTRTPNGAARALLRIAAMKPELVVKAAAQNRAG
jgi:putative transcriptional regulator